MTPSVFHDCCDNRGPLLVLFKTKKGVLCGGFSSIPWKNAGEWTVDKNCFIYSLKLRKVYKPQNDKTNLYFHGNLGPWFGNGASLGIHCNSNNKLYSRCNYDPFQVPKTS